MPTTATTTTAAEAGTPISATQVNATDGSGAGTPDETTSPNPSSPPAGTPMGVNLLTHGQVNITNRRLRR
jgi:hypothetical protein